MYKINTSLVRRYAQRYAEMNMSAKIIITRPDDATLNESTGDVTANTYIDVYEGPARITSTSGPVQYSLGEEQQFFSSGKVMIPLFDTDGSPTTPQVNDLITVIEHHDVLMVNRSFRITDVEASGQFEAVRSMSVVGAQRWEGWNKDPNIPSEWYV